MLKNQNEIIRQLLKREALETLSTHLELYKNSPVELERFIDRLTTPAPKTKSKSSNSDKDKPNPPLANTKTTDAVNTKAIESKSEPILPTTSQTTLNLSRDLSVIADEVEKCTRCALHKSRKKSVFGYGTNKIPLVCVGEAPGEEEDKSGLPFVGTAGQLLTKMLSAINVSREDIFICNVLKCRPPLNRDPNDDEVRACSDYLDRQLAILQPQYILALGRIAAKRLLGVDHTMAQFRGKLYEYKNIPVIVTYHPSALLRNPAWKQPAWEDLQKLKGLLKIN